MTTIQLISEKWLSDKKSQLSMTTGEESRRELEVEIADAERHLAAKNEVIALAAKRGFRRNSYDGVCKVTGEAVKPARGFVVKEGNKWITYSFAAVCDILGYQFEG